MNQYYVYILTNENNSVLYTGVTNDIFRRSNEHKFHFGSKFTKKYNIDKLVYFEEYRSIDDAIKREKQIKAGSRIDKEKLINSMNLVWNDLFTNDSASVKGIAASPSAPRNDREKTLALLKSSSKYVSKFLQVLYEDNHLIAVYKPAGILVQADETGDVCLMDQVKEYLKEKYHKPGEVFLGLVHRLDRPVSGIVLFAKTSKGAARLAEQFRNHTVVKTYQALVSGQPPRTKGTLVHYLSKDKEKNITSVFAEPAPDSLRAELDYEIIEEKNAVALLKINLKTGRPHQIRAQLSFIGCPIIGDLKYGAAAPLPDKSIALSATALSFQTATGNERQSLSVDIPEFWSTLP